MKPLAQNPREAKPLRTAGKKVRAFAFRAAAAFLFIAMADSCARPSPVLSPPPPGVDAVEGYGTASVSGGAVVKGKFSFLFRQPGLGRVEALDPFGRTLYTMLFLGDKAYLVLASKKAYAEDRPEAVMNRFLGFSLTPDDIVRLLCGQWPPAASEPAEPGNGWILERDSGGRVVRGGRNGLSFTVAEFFRPAGVPQTVLFTRGDTAGRMKILSLRFNPAARPDAFDASFLRGFARKSWEEIEEIMSHED